MGTGRQLSLTDNITGCQSGLGGTSCSTEGLRGATCGGETRVQPQGDGGEQGEHWGITSKKHAQQAAQAAQAANGEGSCDVSV